MLAQRPSVSPLGREPTGLAFENADFDASMATHWASLFRTAYLLSGDYHLAEDLLQTVPSS